MFNSFIKSIAVTACAVSLLSSFVPNAYSFGFETNFDDYTAGDTLSGSNGWATNDPFNFGNSNGQNDLVGYFPTVSPVYGGGGNNLGFLGGVYAGATPDRNDVVLSHVVGDYVTGLGANGFRLGLDFAIASSAVNNSKDAFGFTFGDGVTYATLLFTPRTQTVWDGVLTPTGPTTGINNPDNLLEITLSGTAVGSTITSIRDLYYDNIAGLVVSINLLNELTAAIDGVDLFGPVALSGFNPSAVNELRVLQNVQNGLNGTGAGSNFIAFDSISAVPEPSTIGLSVLAGLGGMVAMLRRRKKA